MRLEASFFARPTLEVAPDLLGATLFVESGGHLCSGLITEVEAYLGQEDSASHAASGPTPRSAIMFGPPGVAYVYFIYGMHHCLNFVTEEEGRAGAVLVRAVEPLAGIEVMRERRAGGPDARLSDGPGKLCQALGIDQDWNGSPLDGTGPFPLYLDRAPGPVAMDRTPRIGISKAVDSLYRFVRKEY